MFSSSTTTSRAILALLGLAVVLEPRWVEAVEIIAALRGLEEQIAQVYVEGALPAAAVVGAAGAASEAGPASEADGKQQPSGSASSEAEPSTDGGPQGASQGQPSGSAASSVPEGAPGAAASTDGKPTGDLLGKDDVPSASASPATPGAQAEELPMSRFALGVDDSTPPPQPDGMGHLFDQMRFTVVRIQSIVADVDFFRPFARPKDAESVGSGFAVDSGEESGSVTFVTNAHVVRDARSIEVQLPALGQTLFEAHVPLICNDFDLALVELADPKTFLAELAAHNASLKAMKISSVPVQVGTEVVAVGFPLGSRSLKLSRGIISGTEQVDTAICYQSTAPISPGNSGGPLLQMHGGQVLGVNFASSSSMSAQNINFVVPALHIQQILHEYRANKSERSNGTGFLSKIAPEGAGKQLRGAAGREGAFGAAAAASIEWPHEDLKFAPLDVISLEADEALYNSSGGCSRGVFLSNIPRWSSLSYAEPPVSNRSFLVAVGNSSIDSYGMGYAPHFVSDPIPFESLFQLQNSFDDPVTVTACFDGKERTHVVSMRWRPEYEFGIRDVAEPRYSPEDLDFETFAGVTVMPMTVNHLTQLINVGDSVTLGRWLLPVNRRDPQLMVANVEKGTYASRVLQEGMAVSKINGKRVTTVQQFRDAFIPNGTIWELETDRGLVFAVGFKEEVKRQVEESKSSDTASYLLTQSIRSAMDRVLGEELRQVAVARTANGTDPLGAANAATAVAEAQKAMSALKAVAEHSPEADAAVTLAANALGDAAAVMIGAGGSNTADVNYTSKSSRDRRAVLLQRLSGGVL